MPDPISNLRIVTPDGGTSGKEVAPREWGFMETLQGAMDQSKQLQGAADAKVAGLLDGSGMDVHTAMIAVEQADLSFQLMMQVRNKIVAAYQEISRMQF
jgi:flagellar hook-basal body complex protein FliE